MKKGYAIALIGAVLSGLGLIQPGMSSAVTACPPAPGAPTIAGNVMVSGVCDLSGKTVTGSVTVVSGGSLSMVGGKVGGSVTQTGGSIVMKNVTIKGSVTVTDTTDGSRNDICGGSIGGSVTVSEVSSVSGGTFRLYGADPMNQVLAKEGACASALPALLPLTIGGTVTFDSNQVFVRLSNTQQVGGSVRVLDNMSEIEMGLEAAWVTNNTLIKGSLSCSGNGPVGVKVVQGPGTVKGSRTGQCAA